MASNKASDKKYRTKKCPRCKGEGFVIIKQKRSLSQNKYYWGVVIKMVSIEIGEDENTTHQLMSGKFNYEKKILPDQTISMIPKSTTKLDTKEFVEYTVAIRRWSAEFLNINIPQPNEVDDDHWMELENQYYNMLNQY